MKPQTYYAELLNVSQPTLSHWLSGKHYPWKKYVKMIEEKCPELMERINENGKSKTVNRADGDEL